jgi:hypothetical protein
VTRNANFVPWRSPGKSGQMVVKCRSEETSPPHFTVAEEIDSRILLLAQCQTDRIVLRLTHVVVTVPAALCCL